MANFFDQFDPSAAPAPGASGNFFDQFDEAPSRGWGQALEQEAVAGAHGAQREGMGLGNIVDKVLPNSLQIPDTSNADLQNFDQQHAAEFGNNKAGKVIGEAAPMVAAQFIPGLDLGADAATAAGVGGRALPLALRAASAAGQGAVQGATNAPVGQQASGAATGAALGGAASLGGDALGALARGIVGKAPAAQRLYDLAAQHGNDDFFVPVGQGGTGPVAAGYRLLPYAAFTHGPLTRQSEAWQDAVRGILGENAAPGDVDAAQQLLAGASSPQEAAERIRGAYNGQYRDALSNWQGQMPQDFASDVQQRITADTPDIPRGTASKVGAETASLLNQFADTDAGLTGNNLQNLRQVLKGKLYGGDIENYEKPAYSSAVGAVEDLMKSGLAPEDWQRFQSLNRSYNEASPYLSAVDQAVPTAGRFKFPQVARAANANSQAQSIAQDAQAVASPVSRRLPLVGHGMEAYGLARAAMAGHPGMAAAGLALPRALASVPVQRALYGDTALQQTMRALAAQNPQAVNVAAGAARAGLIGTAQGQ